MITALDIERKLTELKPLLRSKFFVNKIGYFGSFASGKQEENSDVDILVEFSQPLGWEYFDLTELLEKELKTKVDMVSIKALKPQLRDGILHQVKFL